MKYDNLLAEQKNNILIITVNRPEKLNALNKATLSDLHLAISNALKETSIRGIIITGAGNKAFIAGADILEFKGLSADEGKNLSRTGHTKVFNLIENSNKPIIAAINGYALGGGLEVAMACHIRIAATTAKLGQPELKLGLIPGYGGTQRLTRLAGKGKAFEMILSAEPVTAQEALQSGLVNDVVEPEELMSSAEGLLGKILKHPSSAIGAAIRAINAAGDPGSNGFETEINEFGSCFDTYNAAEGISAFIEKRPAQFHP